MIMRFTKVKIDNFYNLKDVDLDLSNGNTLIVGANGTGKSNIVKCVQFLVHQTLTHAPRQRQLIGGNVKLKENELLMSDHESKITNPDEESFIEVHAQLDQGDVKLFSELRVLCLMGDVYDLVCVLAELFLNEIDIQVEKNVKLRSSNSERSKFIRNLRNGHPLFSKLPEKRFDDMIRPSNEGMHNEPFMLSRFRGDSSIWLDNEFVAPLIVEVTDKLFPKLLEITRSALEQWKREPGDHESDVVMKACAQKNADCLKYSLEISGNACRLPLEYSEKENSVISSTLNDVFGDLRGIEFCIKDSSSLESARLSSVDKAIRGLCENNYRHVVIDVIAEDLPQERGIQKYQLHTRFSSMIFNNEKLLNMLQSTDWGILYSSCCSKLINQRCGRNTLPASREDVFKLSARVCLEMSTVNCILPQSRDGMMMEHDEQLLTLNYVEQLLIKTILSADELVQQQFNKVKVGMNSFCGIEIHVLQKEGAVVQNSREEAEEIVALGEALQDKDRVALFEFGHRLRSIGCEMIRKAPSWSGDLHVMVTKTTRNEKSIYSHRIPLSDLSGGEIEILMVLCAIHLSGADVVFLDEPGHSLHPPQQAQLSRWIETLQDPDPVCVVVTHSMEFISRKSLSSLYHMAFRGNGFTPCKLRVDVGGGKQQVVPPEESCASSTVATPSIAPSTSPPVGSSNDITLSKGIISMLIRPDMRKMFFARGLYFVEGVSDKVVLSALRHHLLKKACDTKEKSRGVKHNELLHALEVLEMDQWDILALGGCKDSMKAYRASAELEIPCAIVLDFDTINVKHGGRVKPFSYKTWQSSALYKELTNETLQVASTLLGEIELVFKEGVTEEEALDNTCKILKRHGIWIWKGDLESVLCDNPAVRNQLRETDCFMEALGEKFSLSCSISDRGKMSPEDAIDNYHARVSVPLASFIQDLQNELDAAYDRLCKDPSQCVTEHLQYLIDDSKKYKQALKQHDGFCKKGTKRRALGTSSDMSYPKKFVPDPSQQRQSDQAAPSMLPRDVKPSADAKTIKVGSAEDNIFWDRIKRKLHNGGWMKLPWETLLKVVEVSLEAEEGLQNFCRFMKEWQCKGKRKIEVGDLSQSLLTKLFGS